MPEFLLGDISRDERSGAAADILGAGTNTPGVRRDGISVGFGFNAKRIASPTAVTQVVPLTNLCSN